MQAGRDHGAAREACLTPRAFKGNRARRGRTPPGFGAARAEADRRWRYPCRGCVHCSDTNCPNYPGKPKPPALQRSIRWRLWLRVLATGVALLWGLILGGYVLALGGNPLNAVLLVGVFSYAAFSIWRLRA